MAVASRGRAATAALPHPLLRPWKDRGETSPERTKVWTEPKPRKVAVVYYISRNGQLEHPHFMEVPLSSPDGLHLRDVINRLDVLRGKGLANSYSWSSKRSYRDGYVWHDLCDDDLIHPTHGYEYVLKGSERIDISENTTNVSSSLTATTCKKGLDDSEISHHRHQQIGGRKKTPWSSFDLNEYKVYKTELTAEAAVKAVDASTQTDEHRKNRRRGGGIVVREEGHSDRAEVPRAEAVEEVSPATTELERDEISPPPSSSSPETLESLIKADGRIATVASKATGPEDQDLTVRSYQSGRMRASSVLIQLISCGSINVKDNHHRPQGYSVVPLQYNRRVQREASNLGSKEMGCLMENNSSFSAVRLEDKEYFSGSLLLDNKKKNSDIDGLDEFPGLKRSSSYNADRSSKLELAEGETETVKAKCIPRRSKTMARKETDAVNSRSTHGSKRMNGEAQRQEPK